MRHACRAAVTAAAIALFAGHAFAQDQSQGAWFYCIGIDRATNALSASQVFPGDPASVEIYKEQVRSQLLSLGMLPQTDAAAVACAQHGSQALAEAELGTFLTPANPRFLFAPSGGGLRAPAPAAAPVAAQPAMPQPAVAQPAVAPVVTEPNAVELPADEVALILERNRLEAERAAQLQAEYEAREAARRADEAARQAEYDAARAQYDAAQAAFQAQQLQYQQDLAAQQAAVAEYEKQQAAYEAAIAAGATPVAPY